MTPNPTTPSLSSPPEQGQLVTVRQRRYIATDVTESTLPDSR